MKIRYFFDSDDVWNRYVRPWIIGLTAALLLGLGIWWLVDTIHKNSDEYRRQAEIEESLSKAPEDGDYRSNIPDEEIGNYHYNGEEIINYPGEIYLVKKVVSGSTIVVGFQGRDVRVNIIGAYIPDCYAKTAKDYTKKILLNRRVKLEFDDLYGKTNSEGDIMAYVGLDTFDYGGSMILNGHAKVDESINYGAKDSYLLDQAYAEVRSYGLWDGGCREATVETNVI